MIHSRQVTICETQAGQKQGVYRSYTEESSHCSSLRVSPQPTFPDLLINSPLFKLGENKTVLWSKQRTSVLKWKGYGEHESFRAGGIKPFPSKSRAQRPQSNSAESSPKQSLTQSSVVCKFIEIQSPLPIGRWVRCDPSSQPTLTQAADIVVLKISFLFLLPARGRGREGGRGKRRA